MTDTKDVYAAMAPATYTRTLGSGVGRSPTTIEPIRRAPALSTAVRRMRRRKPGADGAKALADARLRMETKTDPEVLEIYRGARAETKVRHVRTASGVRRYHAPIGTPIVGGHAVTGLPSAGGGRMRAGRNAGRATSGLVGGSSRRGSTGGRGGFTGRSRRGLGTSGGGRRRGGFGGRGHNMPGNGGGGGFGGLAGGGLGSIFSGGKQPAAGPKAKKPPKAKQPKKTPPKAKKAKTSRGSGTGTGNGGKTGTTPKPKTTTAKPTQGQLDQAAQQLLLTPPDRLGGVLRTMPYGVLGPLLTTIQDPDFPNRVAARRNGSANAPAPGGAKSLMVGAAWLVETKDPQPAYGDERCMACGVDIDDTYDTLPSGKGYELVVCVPCAAETKAGGKGSGDSGIPGHLPEQLRRYWTGKGKARWAGSPHPYTALVNALRSEGVPERVIHGLAANLFRDVYGIFPAQRPRALGGSTHGYAR